jgi:hypothetical protein
MDEHAFASAPPTTKIRIQSRSERCPVQGSVTTVRCTAPAKGTKYPWMLVLPLKAVQTVREATEVSVRDTFQGSFPAASVRHMVPSNHIIAIPEHEDHKILSSSSLLPGPLLVNKPDRCSTICNEERLSPIYTPWKGREGPHFRTSGTWSRRNFGIHIFVTVSSTQFCNLSSRVRH